MRMASGKVLVQQVLELDEKLNLYNIAVQRVIMQNLY